MYSIINKEMLKAREKGLHISSPEMKGAVTAAIFAVAVFAIFFEYRCPILAVTGCPCLGCGTTHAVRELLAGAFRGCVPLPRHVLVLSAAVAVLLFRFQASERQAVQRRGARGDSRGLSARVLCPRSAVNAARENNEKINGRISSCFVRIAETKCRKGQFFAPSAGRGSARLRTP